MVAVPIELVARGIEPNAGLTALDEQTVKGALR
jgi:hypothetical protein